MKTTAEIYQQLHTQFGEQLILRIEANNFEPYVVVAQEGLAEVASFLFSTEGLYFDFLSCLTAVDNGVEAATMEVIYHLFSIPYQHKLCMKTIVARSTQAEGTLPSVPSVSHIWRAANWHEREAYDLLGIEFIGHPDMRRILLPSDWEGHPLRKDYTHQEKYHGIRVAY